MACATGIVKFVVFLFNFLCSIVGLALIVLGSVTYSSLNHYGNSTNVLSSDFFTPAILIIVLGVIIFVISFFGCCGVVRRSQCMLTTYAVILIVLFIAQLAIGIYSYIKVKDNTEISDQIKKSMSDEFSHYQPDNDVGKTFDIIQQGFTCCGVNGPADYDGTIPKSCYKDNTVSNAPFSDGCATKLNDWVIKVIKIIGYVAMGIAATELLCAMLALCLSSSIRNELRRHR